jgi:hypothetical protein
MTDAVAIPRTFWVVAVVLLLWALVGNAAYLMQVTMDLDELAKTDAYAAQTFREMPQWAWAAYATAVWSGTAAAIALLLRRKVALWLFMLSLLGIVIQFGRAFTMTDLLAVQGVSAAIFPLVIFAVGAFQIWWCRTCDRQGYLR